ncbi:glycosyltransferase family 2 protein [Oceanimonas pelagia]|uniref:Glycosyltransferase family 2 protein n=1 Tax=Oceanimonas pelagia TaxID=3028314 RepID=A0AA50KLS0_9GAMM|nr:glycosyltransferase family 2 protein [Oceanimonas pelagia]WMC09227.1 glycosyltransferase family 2 protein [Oceanimonas pelagia]
MHLRHSSNDWVLLQGKRTRLTPLGMATFNRYIRRHANAVLLYSDHKVSVPGHSHTLLKPAWSLDLVRASGYPGEVLAIRADALAHALHGQPASGIYELMLYLATRYRNEQFVHIPQVLWHTSTSCREFRQRELNPHILEQHLRHMRVEAQLSCDDHHYLHVHPTLPASPPRVSIIIPTRNMLHYLEPCIDSILANATYPDVEIIVVDNQSDDPATLRYLDKIACNSYVKVLRYPHPFNYSAINNFAAEHATGKILCLLNNDTAVITTDWLERLVAQLLQPGVGVVGAKLLYANHTVQHAGDAVGVAGCAAHMHVGLEADAPGYMGRAILTQDVSAVTGACLLTHTALYRQLGGLNAKHLAVAFNDVDYCLRVREAQYKVMMVPHARLYHYESVSRGGAKTPEKKQRMKQELNYMHQRWQHQLKQDPFYHPHMNKRLADFTPASRFWPWN